MRTRNLVPLLGPTFGRDPLDAKRAELEVQTRAIAEVFVPHLPPGTGFALLLFNFGDTGNTSYISSGEREDLIKVLRETADRLERRGPGGGS